MKIIFHGCGSMATTPAYWQSNALVEKNGKRMLLDCGSDARHSLAEIGVKATDIDAVYVTHLHADHVGGLEWLAFSTYFIPNHPHPKLYGISRMLKTLWNDCLSGGLSSIEGRENELHDYFQIHKLTPNSTFIWENIEFRPVQTCHIMNGFEIVDSFGLLIRDLDDPKNTTVFYTGDTQFAPHQLTAFYGMADLIFHDCETAPYKSGVHAHYGDLLNLPQATKAKMWLYHYQPNPVQVPTMDGFQGFIAKGQVFEFGEELPTPDRG